MEIYVNERPYTFHLGGSLATLVEELGCAQQRIAVEYNGRIVPQGQYSSQLISAGDKIEIITAVGGG